MTRCVVIIKGVTAQSAFKGVAVVSCRLFANLGKVHMIVRMQRVYISQNRLINSSHTKLILCLAIYQKPFIEQHFKD